MKKLITISTLLCLTLITDFALANSVHIEKIQAKNKNLVLNGGLPVNDLKAAERLIKSLDPTGVYLSFTAPDKDTAERMVELVEKWSN